MGPSSTPNAGEYYTVQYRHHQFIIAITRNPVLSVMLYCQMVCLYTFSSTGY